MTLPPKGKSRYLDFGTLPGEQLVYGFHRPEKHVCTPYQITGSHARSRLAYAELAAIALNCCLTNCQLVTTINVYPFPQSYLNNAVSVVPSPLTAPSLSNVTELLIKRKRAPKQIVPDNISMKNKTTHCTHMP